MIENTKDMFRLSSFWLPSGYAVWKVLAVRLRLQSDRLRSTVPLAHDFCQDTALLVVVGLRRETAAIFVKFSRTVSPTNLCSGADWRLR